MVDVAAYAERKRKALKAHESQSDTVFVLGLPEEAQVEAFGRDAFVRRLSRVPTPDREGDVFAGLR